VKDARMDGIVCVDAFSTGWTQTRFCTGLISPNLSTKLVRLVAPVTSLLGRSPLDLIRGVNSLTHVLGVASVGFKGGEERPERQSCY
jgi:hypothetical protein